MAKYICPICQKEYESHIELSKCVLNCSNTMSKKEEESKLKKLTEEKTTRKKALDDAREQFKKLESAFLKDYPDEPIKRNIAPGLDVYVNGNKDAIGTLLDALMGSSLFVHWRCPLTHSIAGGDEMLEAKNTDSILLSV